MAAETSSQYNPLWWANATINISIHILSLMATTLVTPWSKTPTATLIMGAICAQSGIFGVTMGYHRLWTHHAFTARKPLRIALALMGAMGFQGSIRWWVIRHRLHHRYTDDPVHDPYAASRGLFYSHFGWIMNKRGYPRWNMVDKRDLDRDVVVRLQHKHFVPISLVVSFVLPTVLGYLWGDALGGFVWGGLVARVIGKCPVFIAKSVDLSSLVITVWNSISLINSLAHWQGSQPYTDEMSARGDWFVAALTGGEGNHNFHAFPSDYRNGPYVTNWDPTRWLIWTLHKLTSQIPAMHVTPDVDVLKARLYMVKAEVSSMKKKDPVAAEKLEKRALMLQKAIPAQEPKEEPTWGREELENYVIGGKKKVLLIDGHAIDVTSFAKEHPGGATILHEFVVFKDTTGDGPGPVRDATQAFLGKFNSHTWIAREKMKSLSVAEISLPEDDIVEFL